MAHSLNGPSSFSRRMACPGSARMEAPLTDKESVYAAEGSAAHALGEKCLLEGREPAEFWGEKMGEFRHPDGKLEEFFVDGDMIDAVEVYVDHCRPLMNDTTKVEKKLDLRFLGPDEESKTGYVRGTADFGSVCDGILHVVDYKHGKGVPVDAENNTQGLAYGMGMAEDFADLDWDTLRITIVQPRAFSLNSVKSWDVPREDLLDFKLNFSDAAFKTFDDNPEIKAGKQCRFCKAAFQCKGIINFIKEATGMDLLDPTSDPMDMHRMTEQQIVDVLFNRAPVIKGWLAKLEDYAQQRAEGRDPLPGTKLVETRPTRKWKDEEQAIQHFSAMLGEEAFEKKFRTAPQMEKFLGKKKFKDYEDDFVIKTSSGVTLVPSDDPRTSARPSGESEFGSVNLFD